jgi:Zn-dependent protease/CBS domain-containing protein
MEAYGMNWSFKIGSIMGIPVRVHFTFLLLLFLVFFAGNALLGTGGMGGVIFVILVFASVVFHELSHALVARHYGVNVLDIILLPIGGMARVANSPEKPSQEVLIAVAGPIASFVLAFLLWFAADTFGSGVTISDLSVKGDLLAQLCAVNVVLGLFNLIPAFPMDGGRVLRGLLSLSMSPYKATRVAVAVGQGFSVILFVLGLLWMNIFLILIALFVYLGAESEERQMGIMTVLRGATAQTAMNTDVQVLSPASTIGHAAELFCHGFQTDFPVVDGDRLVGLITRETITETLHRQGPSVTIQDVMARDFPTATEQTPLSDVLEKMQSSGYKAVPVIKGAELRGLITLEQIVRYNMLCSGFSCEFLQGERTRA